MRIPVEGLRGGLFQCAPWTTVEGAWQSLRGSSGGGHGVLGPSILAVGSPLCPGVCPSTSSSDPRTDTVRRGPPLPPG